MVHVIQEVCQGQYTADMLRGFCRQALMQGLQPRPLFQREQLSDRACKSVLRTGSQTLPAYTEHTT